MDFDVHAELEDFSINKRPDENFDYDICINSVSDSLAASPLNIINDDIFNHFKQLIYYLPELEEIKEIKRTSLIYYTLTKSLQVEIELIEQEGLNIDALEHKQVVYSYIFLIFISIQHLVPQFENQDKKRKSGSKLNDDDEKKRSQILNNILSSILLNLCGLMEQQLSTILQGEQETVDFCDIVLKSAYIILLSKETIREKTNKTLLVKLICVIAKNHQQNDQVTTRLMMALPFSEHLADPIAEILSTSLETYGNKNLLQDLMVSLASVKDMGTNMAKVVGPFLITLAENLKSDLIEYISYFKAFAKLTQTVRAATMICYGHCINSLSASKELILKYEEDITDLFDDFEKRLLDIYQIVRQRVFQALELIISNPKSELDFKPLRYIWTKNAIVHMQDKSSFVRKAAINFLQSIIQTHPFALNKSKLEWDFYWIAYIEFTKLLKEFDNGVTYNIVLEIEKKNSTETEFLDKIQEQDSYHDIFKPVLGAISSENGNETGGEFEEENKLNIPANAKDLYLKRKMAQDACIFIIQLNQSFKVASNLLNSKTKSDTISAIDYFVIGDAYNITAAKLGIKQMLHLIWTNGASDEGNKVIEKLTDAYVDMFLKPDPMANDSFKKIYIATSLIKLTYNCSMADLISLEKLVIEIYRGKLIETTKKEREVSNYKPKRIYWITPGVIDALWNSFINSKYVKEKRGAIIILGMITLDDYKIMNKKVNWLIDYGLQINDESNYQMMSFSCIALKRTIPKDLPNDYTYPDFTNAIIQLKKILLIDTNDGDWFNLAEETLNTLYEIDPDADKSATEVLKLKALSIFNDDENTNGNLGKTIGLSQLIFMLGHVGLKTIIFLEKCEADFKRKKQADENKKSERDVELDMIGGTNEDDFSDAVQNIKEKELLYGTNSILAKFVPLLVEIIQKPKKYRNEILQRQATLCFAKFMCISPRFCEENLNLYIAIMKKSKDNIVRSNLVLGLGDIAVCFSNIIDENRSALYSLLQDKDLTVQRTCLMTVIFLILAGQIKVKGHFSQLAKLLVHQDHGLREMSKLFFQELATKDNALYNGFIEMLSGLNLYIDDPSPPEEPFPFEKFKGVIKFVLPYIGKDKQRHLLVKKLYSRLKLCTPNERIRFIFCLKEIMRRDEFGSKKDNDTEKTKFYKQVTEDIDKMEEELTA
ncbi:Condensin complex subunit [Pichia californica]|uniref:Condensin complex subunit n=1 Tax=Pichia californica TaxID=460514 RepID=A0A9P7BC90_9ASCO|nr:Condensin complex subunit [[Candida] californica]